MATDLPTRRLGEAAMMEALDAAGLGDADLEANDRWRSDDDNSSPRFYLIEK